MGTSSRDFKLKETLGILLFVLSWILFGYAIVKFNIGAIF